MSGKGYRAGVPAVQIPLSTTNAIGTLNGVSVNVSAITPVDSYLNGPTSALPAGQYQVLAGMVGEDQVNRGYTVGQCCAAAPGTALTLTAGQMIQVQITAANRPANANGSPAIALFLIYGGNTNAQYCGMFPVSQSGDIQVVIDSLPLASAPFFAPSVLTGTANDSAQILGSRSPYAYNWITIGPTGDGNDVGRDVDQITFTPDTAKDVKVATVRSTLVSFSTLPNQMKDIIRAAGGMFVEFAGGLPQPAAPALSTTGTAGTTSYSYVVVAKNTGGDISAASAVATIATGNATLNGTNYNVLTITAVAGATSYDIYRTASGGTPSTTGKVGNTATTTFNDTGLAGDGTTAPTSPTGPNGANFYQGRLSPQIVTAIFPGNRPFRQIMPLNGDGSQEIRTFLAKVIVNQDSIQEQWRKTQQTLIKWQLADIPQDTLLDGTYAELHQSSH